MLDALIDIFVIKHLYTDFGQTADKIISKYDKYIFIGDFNYDMLNCEKSAMLRDICDIFNMQNIVKKATCFTKIAKATLLDLKGYRYRWYFP